MQKTQSAASMLDLESHSRAPSKAKAVDFHPPLPAKAPSHAPLSALQLKPTATLENAGLGIVLPEPVKGVKVTSPIATMQSSSSALLAET